MRSVALIIGCAVALTFIVVYTRVLIEGAASRHWRQVRGTVRQVMIEFTQQSGELDRFVARVDYEYMFEGAPQRNGQFVGQTCTDRDEAVNYGRVYTAGQQIDVFVDPGKPERSTFDPGLKYRNLVPVLFGIVMLVFFLSRLVA
jgi:hypothetical protein